MDTDRIVKGFITDVRLKVCEDCKDKKISVDDELITDNDFMGETCAICGKKDLQLEGLTLEELKEHGWSVTPRLRIECIKAEPCDCGEKIRHHCGGNYHHQHWKVTALF